MRAPLFLVDSRSLVQHGHCTDVVADICCRTGEMLGWIVRRGSNDDCDATALSDVALTMIVIRLRCQMWL